MTYEQLKKHVMDYFGDTRRPASETKVDLGALADECQMLADSIDDSDEG